AHAHGGGPFDSRRGVGERAAGRLHRGQPAQPVGVLLGRQVTRRVGRVQVGAPAGAVGDTPDRDRPESGGQLSVPVRLGPRPRLPVGVDDLVKALLPAGLQVQVVLHQLAQDRYTLGVDAVLYLRVSQLARLRAGQPVHQPAEQLIGGNELFTRQVRRVLRHQNSSGRRSEVRKRNVTKKAWLTR